MGVTLLFLKFNDTTRLGDLMFSVFFGAFWNLQWQNNSSPSSSLCSRWAPRLRENTRTHEKVKPPKTGHPSPFLPVAPKGSILTEQKTIGSQLFFLSLPAQLLACDLVRRKTVPERGQTAPQGGKCRTVPCNTIAFNKEPERPRYRGLSDRKIRELVSPRHALFLGDNSGNIVGVPPFG